MPNYLKEFYSNPTPDYESILSSTTSTDEIESLKAEIKTLERQLENKNQKLKLTYSELYSANYIPSKYEYKMTYSERSTRKNNWSPSDYTFDINPLVTTPDKITIPVTTLQGTVTIVKGYDFTKAAIIVGIYTYSINSTKTKITTKLQEEKVYAFLEPYKQQSCILENTPAAEFLNMMYSVSHTYKNTLDYYARAARLNPNFEMIMKLAPDEILDPLISSTYTKKAKTIPELINMPTVFYNLAIANNKLLEMLSINEILDNFTESNIIHIINQFEEYTKDLDFYNIKYQTYYYENTTYRFRSPNTMLLKFLYQKYNYTQEFKNNYTFTKFAKYVITETINQGYTYLEYYVSELKDYLVMCTAQGSKPCKYTSMLKLTHDIAARNNNINVTSEDETKFKNQYAKIEKRKCSSYYFIPPKNTNDIKREGNELSHCVASYIKRIIDGESLIIFMRKDPDTPLITLEIKNNRINQARGASNRNPNEEEIEALKVYAEKEGLEIDY